MGDLPHYSTPEICVELSEELRRSGLAFAFSPEQKFQEVLTLVKELLCIVVAAFRTIQDRILAGPETAQNADVLSLSQSDLIGTGLILRVTGLRQIQVWINYTVRLELCMVVDLMELMQHMNDTHANWHITSLPTLRKLASKTQRRHITWERQDLQHKMTRYEGFRYNPLVERDVITLLNDWPYELQDISDQNIGVTLGKVTPTSRERILSFVDNRGDFKTFKHELFFIIEYLDESCFFVIRHHPDPAVFRSSSNCTLIRVAHHMVIVRRNRRRKEP